MNRRKREKNRGTVEEGEKKVRREKKEKEGRRRYQYHYYFQIPSGDPLAGNLFLLILDKTRHQDIQITDYNNLFRFV